MAPEIDLSKLKSGEGVPPPGGSMAGAVDLAAPVQIGIGKFKQFMAEQCGVAFVAIGLTQEGQVIVMNHTPQGKIETLGMLAFATAMASPALQPQGPPLPGMEEVPEQEPEQAST